MSDWEEYCDSKGMNAGSSEDYDAWIDGLCESEQEEGKYSMPKKVVVAAACEPTLDHEELVEQLISSTCTERGLDTLFDAPRVHQGGKFDLTTIDGLRDGQSRNLTIRIEYENYVPDSFLAQSIKMSGIPLFSSEFGNGWIAWDEYDQCVRTGPSWAYQAKNNLTLKQITRNKVDPDSTDGHILDFTKRCSLSSDHGMKPLLVRSEDMDDVACKREVEIERPRIHSPNEHENYLLAFYNALGAVRFLPLRLFIKLGVPVHTRTTSYYEHRDTLYPSINAASMLAHGFLLATKIHPVKFEFFRVRARASVFQSVIQRIETPSFVTNAYVPYDEPNPSLRLAERIVQWSQELTDKIYITNKGHPLEAELVTSPEMLLNALQKLDQHGFISEKSYPDKVVMKRKADQPNNNQF